jgi:hypothetical protein
MGIRKENGDYDFEKAKAKILAKKQKIKDKLDRNNWTIKYKKKRNQSLHTPRPRIYQQWEPMYNFLKYYRTIRVWAARAHNLSLRDLELLLYMHDEGIFSRVYITEYNSSIDWNIGRFNRLLKDGWLEFYRHSYNHTPDKAAIYRMSSRGKHMINSIYRKLLLKEKIPLYSTLNPEYSTIMTGTYKQHRKQVKKFNDAVDKKNSIKDYREELLL